MFALPDHGRTRQHDGEDRDVVDDLGDCHEPARFQVRIELRADGQGDRQAGVALAAIQELADLGLDDRLDVGGAVAGEGHGGGVDVELDRGVAPGQHVGLKVWRNVDDEAVEPRVHHPVDLVQADRAGGSRAAETRPEFARRAPNGPRRQPRSPRS